MTNNEDPTNIDNSGLEDNVSEDQPDTTSLWFRLRGN